MSLYIDAALGWLKWPAALLAVAGLPFSLLASWRLLAKILANPAPLAALVIGLALYLVLWQALLRKRIFGTFFSTLEHELTHALFALATLHAVTGIRATFSRGGHIRYRGAGNWLITISPYFFPTICFLIIVATAVIPDAWRWWADALLGAATAYHLTSTVRETHPGQTDLQKVGYLFSVLFLPTANIVAFGTVVAFCHSGLAGVVAFLGNMWPLSS